LQNNTFSRLIVGQKIVVLKRVDSTNNYIKRELAKSTPFSEGTVIMAEDQYSGRGQAQNKWLSPPGLNLTFSTVLYPSFLSPESQFELNIAISLAINDVLSEIIGSDIKIKWPNDIYYRNSKVGGVLIENSIQGRSLKSSIIGIGLNVNQTEFDPQLVHVTSLKNILGRDVELKELLTALCKSIENRYLKITSDHSAHRAEYLRCLYRYNEKHKFVNKEEFFGIITGVDEVGRIVIDSEGEQKVFSFKEVSFVI